MMKLTKGDPNNLEGRVIIYSRFKKLVNVPECKQCNLDLEDGTFFALYFSVDPEDVKKEGFSEKHFDKEEKITKTKEFFQTKGMDDYVTAFLCRPELEPEKEWPKFAEDILFVGEYLSPVKCSIANNAGLHLYTLALEDQLKKARVEINLRQRTYHDVKGEQVMAYIINHYITPMFSAKQFKDNKMFEHLKKDFIRFSAGSQFERDVLELCGVIESGKIDTELTDAYITKIVSIHTQNFEAAALMRDRKKE